MGTLTRTTIALNSRQRVRLNATVGTATIGDNPYNHTTVWGEYWATYLDSDDDVVVRYRTPGSRTFDVTTTVTSSADCSDPRVVALTDRRALLVYARGGNTVVRESYDDGLTWTAEATVITGGTHPTLAVGRLGEVIIAAYVSGGINASRRYPGDTAYGAVFTFVDDLGGDLAVADDTFGIAQLADNQLRWLLHVLIDGEAATSNWESWDDCATWKLIT